MKKPLCRWFAVPLVLIGILSATATAAWATDYVVNGDFVSGTTGFTTSYSYSAVDTAPNQYNVISGNGQSWNGGFVAFTGPAGAADPYFIADGGPSTTASVWQQTASSPAGIVITSDTTSPSYYRFQAQVLWADPDNNFYAIPDLSFELSVNGGSFNALTSTPNFKVFGPGTWVTVYGDGYFLSTPTSIGFKLRNQQTSPFGNDFGIDTIYFGPTTSSPSYLAGDTTIRNVGDLANPTFIAPVPEPSTYAMALAGLACGGYSMFRRGKRACHKLR